MCDDDPRLIIDDNNEACAADNIALPVDGQKSTPNKGFRRSVSPSTSSTSSSSGSSSSSTSSGASFPLNGQPAEKPSEKQQQARKRKKEEVKVTPRKANENSKVTDTENKKHKPERPSRTNKHCQTDDLHQQPLRPDTNVLLDITIVFAPDPNTLFFTTKWKGRSYTGVLTDGLSSKNQYFALKRERAERLNGGKNAGGVQNGQSPSLKPRGKRALNRGGALDRKGRNEEFSIFDPPDELDTKPAKLVKVQDGEAQKMFTRCPHKQCGHLFETVNEVNHHLLFTHVSEPAVIKETTACQYSPIATTSTGSDPVQELKRSGLCTKCREPVDKPKSSELKPTDQKKSAVSPSYSDISAEDDAPTLIKEDSYDKNDESRQQAGLNLQQNPLLTAKLPTPNSSVTTNPATTNSLTPRRTETTSKAASNSSTPAPTSSTPLPNKQRTALTPNMTQAQQQPRLMPPPPNFGLPFGQPSPQQQQMFNNQQILTIMNMMNASAALQQPNAPPPIKAGGSITAGSSSFSNVPQTSMNLSGSSTIGPSGIGGIGIVHPHLGALNGLAASNTPTSSAQNDATRHKIHELKSGDANAQTTLLGVNNIAFQQQQQQRNASPNTTNIASMNNIPRGQQQMFVRPPTSLAPNQPFPFFQRVPGVLPHQAPFMNQAQLSQMFGLGGMQAPGQMMPQQPK